MNPLESVGFLRVRYGETDQMGYAYHAHAAFWFDVARTELLRRSGLVYRELEEQGWILPVLSIQVNYHLAAHYDDELELFAAFQHVKKGRHFSKRQFEIRYEVRRGQERCYTGLTRHCFLREVEGRRNVSQLPEFMLERLGDA